MNNDVQMVAAQLREMGWDHHLRTGRAPQSRFERLFEIDICDAGRLDGDEFQMTLSSFGESVRSFLVSA